MLLSGCQCKPDAYGDTVLFEVPFTVEVPGDTINGGDSIRIFADFSKNVLERNSGLNILLEDFDFFTEIGFAEISGETERSVLPGFVVIEGEVDTLPLVTSVSYPITYNDLGDRCMFEAYMIVPEQSGLYIVGINTNGRLYEDYRHPALVQCGNDRRSTVDVYYNNENSTVENYENIYLQTQVDYLPGIVTLDVFQRGGAVAFYVR